MCSWLSTRLVLPGQLKIYDLASKFICIERCPFSIKMNSVPPKLVGKWRTAVYKLDIVPCHTPVAEVCVNFINTVPHHASLTSWGYLPNKYGSFICAP